MSVRTKATPALAKEAWEATPKPSVRKVAERLTAAGHKVSYRTVAKWKADNWKEPKETVEKIAQAASDKIEDAKGLVLASDEAKSEDEKKLVPSLSDETTTQVLGETALRETIQTGRELLAVLARTAAAQMMTAPEAAAKALATIAVGITGSLEALSKLPALNGDGAKLVHGQELILPPRERPLRDVVAEFKKTKEAA